MRPAQSHYLARAAAYPVPAQYRAHRRSPEAPAVTTPIGTRMEPSAQARIVFVGGPCDGQEDTLEVPGGVPTIVAVDEPLGCYVRADKA